MSLQNLIWIFAIGLHNFYSRYKTTNFHGFVCIPWYRVSYVTLNLGNSAHFTVLLARVILQIVSFWKRTFIDQQNERRHHSESRTTTSNQDEIKVEKGDITNPRHYKWFNWDLYFLQSDSMMMGLGGMYSRHMFYYITKRKFL